MNLVIRMLLGLVVVVGLAAGFVVVRRALALRAMEAAWDQGQVAPLPDAGSTTTLEILPLVELEAASPELLAERGVSYLIRTDAVTLLLDFGMNEGGLDPTVLEQNMAALGVTLDEIDIITISHAHPDHVGGFDRWRQGTFAFGATQPDLGERPIYVPRDMTYPGASPVVQAEPAVVAPGVITTGTIEFPEVSVFSALQPTNQEQAIVVIVEGVGPVVITGCGHPGVEKIVTRAEALTGMPIAGIVGGLHYVDATAEELQPQIDFLAAREVQVIGLSPHDSLPPAVAAFRAAFPEAYHAVQVGAPIVVGG